MLSSAFGFAKRKKCLYWGGSTMKLKWIASHKLQDFLHEEGIYPVYVSTGGDAAYQKTKKYWEAIDKYNV